MTSSEDTALDEGALEATASRAGTFHCGTTAGAGVRVGLVASRFNGGITLRLLDGALEALEESGVDPQSVSLAWVPGAFEIPLVASRFAGSGEVDVVLVLGAVIRGETAHFDFVAGECAAGCRQVSLATGVPVVFGVLTTEDARQALERSAPGEANRGRDAARTALEMVDLLAKLPGRGAVAVGGTC